jgi:hypothetical protein
MKTLVLAVAGYNLAETGGQDREKGDILGVAGRGQGSARAGWRPSHQTAEKEDRIHGEK